jgi:PPOX class probable F420-dependent enzyme
MATLPQGLKDMLNDKVFAHLTTLMPDGSPQASPVWVDVEGDEIVINTAENRVKDKNMKRDPRVAISVTAIDNPYKAFMIRGRVTRHTTQGGDAHIDKLAKKYMGVDSYPLRNAAETRIIYRITADKISRMG